MKLLKPGRPTMAVPRTDRMRAYPAKTAAPSPWIPRMIAVDELAESLGVCSRTVRRWIAHGDLHAHRLGRRILIAEQDAAAFVAAGRR
jgi:excisionase family DNA binding protein